MAEQQRSLLLKPKLGLFDAICLAVGTMIGSGIFVSATTTFRILEEAPLWSLIAWTVGAFISLAGALCYAELGAMFSQAGGEYQYLKQSFGGFWGYLLTWTNITVYATGSIALMSFTSASYLVGVLLPNSNHPEGWTIGLACALVAALTLLNCLGLRAGSSTQNLLTLIKLLGIGLLLLLGLLNLSRLNFAQLTSGGHFLAADDSITVSGEPVFAFGSATIAALWAYDGWNNLNKVAEETREAPKILPLALPLSVGIVGLIYLLMNGLYLSALSPTALSQTAQIAIDTARALAPNNAHLGNLIGLLIFLSAGAAANGSILANSRVYFAAARDSLFFRLFAAVHPRTQVPVYSLLVQGGITIVLLLLGQNFRNILSYFAFSAWFFYGACALALLYLRWRQPERERPYRVPLYPWTPLLFLLCAGYLLLSEIIFSPQQTAWAALAIAAGGLLYPFFRGRRRMEKTA